MADTDTTPNDQIPEKEPASPESLEAQQNALESVDTTQAKTGDAAPPDLPSDPSEPPDGSPPTKKKRKLFRQLRQQVNVYPLLFGLVILVAGIIILVAYLQSQHASTTNGLKTQSLSQSTLQQLANSDATVGSSQSILNVESSAVFAGQVLIRQNLQVAGNLQIGGTVALNNITVAGTGQFGQATISKNLAVSGDTAIQGAATIAKSLQVNGNGTFSGPLSAPQVTTANLQLSGDLVLNHHITVGGSTPGRSNGSALGSGGSASVSGSDTAGSVSINTGGSPAAGCFATITFTSPYAVTPYVMVTPIGSAAGGLSYYVNRTTTNFSICDASAPPAGSSFGFDYFVVD